MGAGLGADENFRVWKLIRKVVGASFLLGLVFMDSCLPASLKDLGIAAV